METNVTIYWSDGVVSHESFRNEIEMNDYINTMVCSGSPDVLETVADNPTWNE